MKTLKITFGLLILLLFASCKKIVLGEDPINSPENNFEMFWTDFDEHYGLFGVRGIDWNEQYNTFRPQVDAQTSYEELWEVCTELIEVLDDGHTFLYDIKDDIFYESGSELGDQAEEEFSLDLVKNNFLESLTAVDNNFEFSFGKVKNKPIGYIYLGSMDEHDPNKIDEVLANLKQHEAIIIDLRNNGGGRDEFSDRVAGAFADGNHFAYTVETRNGPGHDDFGPKKEFFTSKQGNESFQKPVILLTDRYTVSAAEIFLLHMKLFDHVTQLGDTTAGDFSDNSMQRFLPNGWIYGFSIQKFLLPNGESLDGIGHIPDVYIKNTKANIASEEDVVMDRAIQYLFEVFGIQ